MCRLNLEGKMGRFGVDLKGLKTRRLCCCLLFCTLVCIVFWSPEAKSLSKRTTEAMCKKTQTTFNLQGKSVPWSFAISQAMFFPLHELEGKSLNQICSSTATLRLENKSEHSMSANICYIWLRHKRQHPRHKVTGIH